MGYMLIAEGHGSYDPENDTSRIGDIEVPGDRMGVNILLSAFAACISKKVSTILGIGEGIVEVRIEAYTSIDTLSRGEEPFMEKFVVHIVVPKGYEAGEVREAAKKCPGLRLIIDKVEDIVVAES
ncbi:MAG: hypothetical protein GSR86_04555 [Desulfurococcales archaeon]|nr:hypothetical protein [Desulfurococcales archaeon]